MSDILLGTERWKNGVWLVVLFVALAAQIGILIDGARISPDTFHLMASAILCQISPNELDKEIQAHVVKDQRSLPYRSKVFSAVAKIQGFDVLPEVGTPEELTAAINETGRTELQRGMSATKGISSHFYATELIRGSMYPGTLSAFGDGMYFATPSQKSEVGEAAFPLISRIAMQYTGGPEGAGILVRAALKKDAKIVSCENLKSEFRENRNRVIRAGITDVGAFAAALGFDAFYVEGVYADRLEEVVYVVLNRGALLVQTTCLMAH